MIEEYCNNYGNQFTIGNQEDAFKFYIHVGASIDNNNDTFPGEKIYDTEEKQYLCCIECDKRSETNENNNKHTNIFAFKKFTKLVREKYP